jgi:hypothetical protein
MKTGNSFTHMRLESGGRQRDEKIRTTMSRIRKETTASSLASRFSQEISDLVEKVRKKKRGHSDLSARRRSTKRKPYKSPSGKPLKQKYLKGRKYNNNKESSKGGFKKEKRVKG